MQWYLDLFCGAVICFVVMKGVRSTDLMGFIALSGSISNILLIFQFCLYFPPLYDTIQQVCIKMHTYLPNMELTVRDHPVRKQN